MKTLSGVIVVLVLLLGSAFLFMTNRAHAVGKAKCEGSYEIKLGLDPNGCETKEPLHATVEQFDEWLKAAKVGEECYKIRVWKNHQLEKEFGGLDVVQCVASESAESKKVEMFQPSGTGGTQRVMFNTSTGKEAFERQIKAAK